MRVLTDAAGEHKNVDAAEHGDHPPELAAHAVRVNVEGEAGPCVALGARGENIANISTGDTRQSRESRVDLEGESDLGGREPPVLR